MTQTVRNLHILVLVGGAGLPAMIGCALAAARAQERVPDEIHLVATPDALTQVNRQLLDDSGGRNRLVNLCASLGIKRDDILLNRRTLHPIRPGDTLLLGDEAERMFQLLRQLGEDGRRELTVVIAHDAAALGVLAHAAMQIVARPHDRLFVEVEESRPRRRKNVESPMRWRCAEVPLLLRHRDDAPVAHYMVAVDARRVERQRLESPDPLRLDVRRRAVAIGRTAVRLPAMQFFWLYYLAASAGERFPLSDISAALSSSRRPSPLFVQKLAGGATRTFPADLQRAFARVFPQGLDKFDAMFLRSCGPHPGLPSTISKINAALRKALGRGAAPYLIKGGRGSGGYRVTLPADSIHIVEDSGGRTA